MSLPDSLQGNENYSCLLLVISFVKIVKPCWLNLKVTTLPLDAAAINCTVYLSTDKVDRFHQRSLSSVL